MKRKNETKLKRRKRENYAVKIILLSVKIDKIEQAIRLPLPCFFAFFFVWLFVPFE